MKKFVATALLTLWAPLALAIQPYVYGDKTPGGVAAVEQKLTAEGFKVIGKHSPRGIGGTIIIATEDGLLNTVRGTGGSTIVAAPVRVAVQSDGTVSYANPEYWGRAYFRKQYSSADPAVKNVQAKLAKALGAGKEFGGDEPAGDLANYKYMMGMEKFDSDKNELKTYGSFDQAVAAVRGNLAKGVNNTAKSYEIVMPDKKIAVFGVLMNDPMTGEGSWLKKIGSSQMAALPYEIYIENNKVKAMYGRYRIALGWPKLGMGTFMSISDAPDQILETLTGVAGGVYEKSSAF